MASRAAKAAKAAIAVETKFSQLRLSGELKSADALPYGSLKGFQGSDHCFSYRLAPHHAYSINAGQAISKSYHPDNYHIKHALLNKTSPLWISVFCAKLNGGNKRVIRAHMIRRVRTAITDALKAHGYDCSGKRISAGVGNFNKDQDLFGTILLSAKEPALTTEMDVIRKQAAMAVKTLILMSKEKYENEQSNTHQSLHRPGMKFNQVKRIKLGDRRRGS
ncbi:hypothetical protein MFRU_037g00060 [Monilinia fructicola]|nr:hypothetical protein MFRU_037g00060 [Monilinia fructicola]